MSKIIIPCAMAAYFGRMVRGVEGAVTSLAVGFFHLGMVRSIIGLPEGAPFELEHLLGIAFSKEAGADIVEAILHNGIRREPPKAGWDFGLEHTIEQEVLAKGRKFDLATVNQAKVDATTRLFLHGIGYCNFPPHLLSAARRTLGLEGKQEQNKQQTAPAPAQKKAEPKVAEKKVAPAPLPPKAPPALKVVKPAKLIPCVLARVWGKGEVEATFTVAPGEVCRLLDIKPTELTVEMLLALAFNEANGASALDRKGVKYMRLERALGSFNSSARMSLADASHLEVDVELAWSIQQVIYGQLGIISTPSAEDLASAKHTVRKAVEGRLDHDDSKRAPVTAEDISALAAAIKNK